MENLPKSFPVIADGNKTFLPVEGTILNKSI